MTGDIKTPDIKKFIDKLGIASMLVGKITYKNNFYGYLVFGEKNTLRIWQNEDIALLLLVSRLIGNCMYFENK